MLKNFEQYNKKLETIIEKNSITLLPFVTVLWFMKMIDELVNKQALDYQIDVIIQSFSDNYKILQETFNINITNKAHVIIPHLSDYLKTNDTTLLCSTDQIIEATHSKLHNYLKTHGYYRKLTDLPDFGEKLFNGICAWNSYVLNEINT